MLNLAKVTCPICNEVRRVRTEQYKIGQSGWAKHPYDVRICNSCSHRGSTKKKRKKPTWQDTLIPSDVLHSQVKIFTQEEIDAIAPTLSPPKSKKEVVLPNYRDKHR